MKTKLIERKKRKYCPECNFIHYVNPAPVVVIVVCKNDKIVLVKRKFNPGKDRWALPGGFIDFDETPEQAAVRELKEETNLSASKLKFITLTSYKSKFYGQLIIIGYSAEKVTGDLIPDDDAADANYYSLKDLPDIPFKAHKYILDEYLSMKK